MKLSSNMIRVYNQFGIKGMIDLFAKLDIKAIDFNSDIPEILQKGIDKDFYTDIKKYADDKGVEFGQTHALFCRAGWPVEEHEWRTKVIIEAFYVAKILGAPCTVVHPIRNGEFPGWENADLYEETYKYYKSLIPYAEETGVKIAIENIRGAVTFEPEILLRLLNDLNNPVFTVCFDVGHCLLANLDPAEEIRRFRGDQIGCTHVHDNDGVKDEHTLPFYGKIDWDSVCKAFADINYSNNINYESAGFVKNIPGDFCEQAYSYMSQVGHYLIDKINFYKLNK